MLIWSLTCFENAKRVLGFELLFCFVQNYSKFKFISSEQAEFVRRLEYNFFERSEFEQCFLPHLALMEIQITNNNNKDIKAFGLLSGWLSLCQPTNNTQVAYLRIKWRGQWRFIFTVYPANLPLKRNTITIYTPHHCRLLPTLRNEYALRNKKEHPCLHRYTSWLPLTTSTLGNESALGNKKEHPLIINRFMSKSSSTH